MKCIQCNSKLLSPKRIYCSNKCKEKHYSTLTEKKNPNTSFNQLKGYLKRKLEAIELLGGKCKICGYCKNLSALHFHHRDSENKSFALDARAFANRNKKLLLNEILKCDLLCANCHAEIHYPDNEIVNIKNFNLSKTKSLNEIKIQRCCVNCGKNKKNDSELCRACWHISNRKFDRPSPEDLIFDLIEFKNSSKISKKYKCSHKAIEKWFLYYNIDYRKLKKFLNEWRLQVRIL